MFRVKRQSMPPKKDKQVFKKTSKNTKRINVEVSQFRGGIKL